MEKMMKQYPKIRVKDYYALTYGQNGAVSVPKELLLFLDWPTSVLLSFLFTKMVENNDDNFMCSDEEIMAGAFLTKRELLASMKFLRNVKGFVESTMTGFPAKRRIRLRYKKINKEVENHLKKFGLKIHKQNQFGSYFAENSDQWVQPSIFDITSSNTSYLSKLPKTSKSQKSIRTDLKEVSHKNNDSKSNYFIETKKASPITYMEHDLERAKTLSKELAKRGKITRRFSHKIWAREFARLRVVDKENDDTITNVLEWYIHHIGEEYIPLAFSAKGFRFKFSKIKEKYERDRPIPIDGDIAQMSSNLKMTLNWPKGTKNDVPLTSQLTANSYDDFLTWIRKSSKKIKKANCPNLNKMQRSKLRNFLKYLSSTLPSVLNFVEGWMRSVSEDINGWKNFNGDLRYLGWNGDLAKKRFYKWFMEYYQNWDRDIAVLYTQLKELPKSWK